MEIQKHIENLVKQARERSFANSPQITLGELIVEIEKCGLLSNSEEDKTICYDFGTAIPTNLDSYRGSYDELALGYKLTGYDNNEEHFASVKAKDLLQHSIPFQPDIRLLLVLHIQLRIPIVLVSLYFVFKLIIRDKTYC